MVGRGLVCRVWVGCIGCLAWVLLLGYMVSLGIGLLRWYGGVVCLGYLRVFADCVLGTLEVLVWVILPM